MAGPEVDPALEGAHPRSGRGRPVLARFARFKPAVGRPVLLGLAGGLWMVVGLSLVRLAWIWLGDLDRDQALWRAAGAGAAAVVIAYFGFLRIVDKNLGRLPARGKRCVFGFISWKSYFVIAIMIAMGFGLRHSSLPKPWLAVFYIAMGGALVLSSLRYWRVLLAPARSD